MLWTTGLRLFKIVYKEEIGNGAYGAVFTADYPFSGINDKVQEFRVLDSSFSRFRGLHFQVLGGSFASLGCFVFEFWVLRFQDLGAPCFSLRFRVLHFQNYPTVHVSA